MSEVSLEGVKSGETVGVWTIIAEYKVPAVFVKPVAEREAVELNIIRQYNFNFKQQAEDSAAYARHLESVLRELQNSPSWKLTAPLRRLAALVRK